MSTIHVSCFLKQERLTSLLFIIIIYRATSPLVGLELGEPLPDDMSTWDEADVQKANETMEKIRELGWYQEDVRGANFVRLKGALGQADRIVMIDFESMKKEEP